MTHVSDFTKTEGQIILDLINEVNRSNLTLNQVELINLVEGVNGSTQLTVSPKPGSGIEGTMVVTYNRVDLSDFAVAFGQPALAVDITTETTTGDLLPLINQKLGTTLTSDDIVDRPMTELTAAPNGTADVTLEFTDDSLVFHGTATVSVTEV